MNEYRKHKTELLQSFATSIERRLQVSRARGDNDNASMARQRQAVADLNKAQAYIEKHTELAAHPCAICGSTDAHQHNGWN